MINQVNKLLKSSLISVFFLGFILGNTQVLHSQVDDEFWFVVPELSAARNNYGGIPATLRIATLELEATVTVSMPANAYHPTLNPTGFQPIVVNIPATDDAAIDFSHMIDSVGLPRTGLENMALDPTGINPFGLHIEATNMINCYWEVNYDYGADVWTLKGGNGLGTEFFTPFQTTYPTRPTPGPQAYSAIDVVATVDGTEVRFELPTGVNARYGSSYLPYISGDPVILDRGETFSLFPDYVNDKDARLAGTRVTAVNGPIAVVVKDDAVATPPNGAVVLGDQLVPVDVAGNHYIMPDVWNPNDIYVIATEDNTMIYAYDKDGILLAGAPYGPLSRGEQVLVDIPSGSKFGRLTSWLPGDTGPDFIVYQAAIVNKARAGAIVPAIGCTGNTQLAFTRARDDNTFYMFVIVKEENKDKFVFDKGLIDPDDILKPTLWTEIQGSGGYWAILAPANSNTYPPGQHLVQNTGGIFHLGIMNGFPAGPKARLYYGYYSDFGGLNIGANVAGTNSEIIKTCYGVPVQLYAFGGTEYTWTPDTYLDDANINLPTAINLPPGSHNYSVEVSGACATGSVLLTVLVSSPVEGHFQANVNSGCSPLEITLDDQSTGNVFWQYDLGDGSPLIKYDLDNATTSIPEPPGYPNPFTISHNYLNNDTAEIYDTVTLLVKNSSGCSDILRKTMVVFPEIESDFQVAGGVDSGCDPLLVQFQDNSTGNTDTWLWDFGDGGSTTEQSPEHLFRNLFGPGDTTFQTRLVATSPFYCRDTSYHTISVKPYIEANFAFDSVFACTPHEVRITDQSIGADKYFWDFGDGTNSTSAGPVISKIFVNTLAVPDTFQIKLRVENDQGCSDSITREVVIYPELDADFVALPTEGCSPFGVNFGNSSSGAATYFWDFGDGGTSTETNPAHLFERSLIDHDTLYTVSLVATSSELCRDTAYTNILVHPYIESAFTVDDVIGCHPFTVTIDNQSIGADQYAWDFGDTKPGSGTSSPSFNYIYENTTNATFVYPLQLVVSNPEGCTDTLIKNITVHPEMTSNFSTDVNSGCHPLTVTFTDQSLNAAEYYWDFGDGASSVVPSLAHTFTNFGTSDSVYSVTLTTYSTDGECVKALTRDITVSGNVEAEFTYPKALDCTPFNLSFENLSVGATSFTWDFGDGTVLPTGSTNSVSHTFVNDDSSMVKDYEVSLVAANISGCSNEIRKTVSVYPAIRSSFTVTDSIGCHPLNIIFNNTSSGALNYVWRFGDGSGSNLEDPSHSFANTGTADSVYTVELLSIASNNLCRDSVTKEIIVYPYVSANFSTPDYLGCNPFDVIIENSSVNASLYRWDFGDGKDTVTINTNSITHRYSNPGFISQKQFEITLEAETVRGCTDEISRIITVEPDIHAEFTASQVLGCHPLIVNFTNLSDGVSIYHWDFGNGNTSKSPNPSQTFTNIGTIDTTYQVWLYIWAGNNVCQDSFSLDIVVHPLVNADFAIEYLEQCTPAEVRFTNSSMNGQDYSWSFDGTPLFTTSMAPINRTFTNNSTTSTANYLVDLSVTSPQGCISAISKQVTVHHRIEAVFTNITEGCQPLEVSFTNNSLGAVVYNWEFGDNSSSIAKSPSHTYNNFGNSDSILNVRLVIVSENQCRDTAFSQITVHPVPKAKLSVDKIVDCSPLVVSIQNLSEAGDSYTWNFGDGSPPVDTNSMVSLNHSYTNDQVNVQINELRLDVLTNHGCTDFITQNLTVYPSVSTDFERDSAGCSPYSSQFRNTTQRASSYVWDFGDGTASFIFEPGHTFVNEGVIDTIFYVELRGYSVYGCEDSTTHTVTVYPSPVARFNYNPIYQYFPSSTVTLNNESSDGNYSYDWDFDDGINSPEKDPQSHTYSHWGEYNIQLDVSNDQCTDSVVHWIKIFPPQPIAAFVPNIDTGCVPLVVSFANNSLYGEEYFWEFDDGGTSSDFEPTYIFEKEGYYQVKLTVKGEGGEDFAFHEIRVFILPIPDFLVEPDLVMLPDQPAKVFNFSKHGTRFLWDMGDGTTYEIKDTVHQYTELGVYDVSLTAWTDKGCEAYLNMPEAVTVIGKGQIIYPNAFAPNVSGPSGGYYNPNDVSNEIFFPYHDGVIEFELYIYNRWGELVFETTDVNQGWDGWCGSQRCTEGVYVWKVQARYSNGVFDTQVGDVTLLHKKQ